MTATDLTNDNRDLATAGFRPVSPERHADRVAESRAEDDPQERRRLAGHQKCGGGWRVVRKRRLSD